jgi:hypothetical protein
MGWGRVPGGLHRVGGGEAAWVHFVPVASPSGVARSVIILPDIGEVAFSPRVEYEPGGKITAWGGRAAGRVKVLDCGRAIGSRRCDDLLQSHEDRLRQRLKIGGRGVFRCALRTAWHPRIRHAQRPRTGERSRSRVAGGGAGVGGWGRSPTFTQIACRMITCRRRRSRLRYTGGRLGDPALPEGCSVHGRPARRSGPTGGMLGARAASLEIWAYRRDARCTGGRLGDPALPEGCSVHGRPAWRSGPTGGMLGARAAGLGIWAYRRG